MLRWLDRYPVTIETKGSGTVLKAKKIWITSNIDPIEWYRHKATEDQVSALMRRMKVTYVCAPIVFDDPSEPSSITYRSEGSLDQTNVVQIHTSELSQ